VIQDSLSDRWRFGLTGWNLFWFSTVDQTEGEDDLWEIITCRRFSEMKAMICFLQVQMSANSLVVKLQMFPAVVVHM